MECPGFSFCATRNTWFCLLPECAEEVIRSYFQPLYTRVDNNTNDQDYIPNSGEIDGCDRSTWHELERRIFEELISRDSRYLLAKEQWSAVLADLKQMAQQKDDPALIAQFLRQKRAELLGVS
jgi:exonuclease SbcD